MDYPFANSGNAPISSIGYPIFHPSKENHAYGGWNYFKMNILCQNENETTQKKTLQSICDIMYDPRYIYQYLRTGLRQNLEDLWNNSDESVCAKAAEILSIITISPAGRIAFLDFDLLDGAEILIDHKLENIRKHAYIALKNLSINPEGAAAIVYQNLMINLIRKLKEEKDENVVIVLETLHECSKVNDFKTEKVLNAGGTIIIADLFDRGSIEVKRKAALVMGDLCLSKLGKTLACELAIDVILKHLETAIDSDFRAKICYSLSMITIINKGKFKVVEGNALPVLLNMLEDPCAETRKNCLKVITTLAEVPSGRQFLLENIKEIYYLLSDENEEVRAAAEIAYDVIAWKPC